MSSALPRRPFGAGTGQRPYFTCQQQQLHPVLYKVRRHYAVPVALNLGIAERPVSRLALDPDPRRPRPHTPPGFHQRCLAPSDHPVTCFSGTTPQSIRKAPRLAWLTHAVVLLPFSHHDRETSPLFRLHKGPPLLTPHLIRALFITQSFDYRSPFVDLNQHIRYGTSVPTCMSVSIPVLDTEGLASLSLCPNLSVASSLICSTGFCKRRKRKRPP